YVVDISLLLLLLGSPLFVGKIKISFYLNYL
ncbi:MAG: hypothetical protein ACI8YB_000916, partial [Patiriisocius sp.]